MGKIADHAKPRIRKVVEQGYGWIRVRRVNSMPTFTSESEVPSDPSKIPETEIEEGYVRAEVLPDEMEAKFELDGKEKTVPISDLYADRPRNLGLLLDKDRTDKSK